MRVAIIALNSKYIHSSLAPWYLKASCEMICDNVEVLEFTINDNLDSILSKICTVNADILAFSCYIWNISLVDKICACVKKIHPGKILILGGPEVSFFDEAKYNHVFDYIIRGEGEETFSSLLITIKNGGNSEFLNKYHIVEDLNTLPSPYTEEMLSRCKNRILYFEASRGCPNSCSYCLSSCSKGVRYFSLERVYSDLKKIIAAGPRQVKFVDRTFNCNPSRALAILGYIIEIEKSAQSKINFHFEISADLLNGKMLEIIEQAPVGLFQFEVGVQTVKQATHDIVGRSCNMDKLELNIKKLISFSNAHIHLDLIAGLPCETLKDIINSFNYVYSFKPHQLQIGFLKLLRGSRIREESILHGYYYQDFPPYEVLSNAYITYEELCQVKSVENAVDKFYNSGYFSITLNYLEPFFSSMYDMYFQLSTSLSDTSLYVVLWKIGINVGVDSSFLASCIWQDYAACGVNGAFPDFLVQYGSEDEGVRNMVFDILKNEDFIRDFIPQWNGFPAKKIYKNISWAIFYKNDEKYGIFLFDKTNKNSVTGRYISRYVEICRNM